jgi:hypothetical protein
MEAIMRKLITIGLFLGLAGCGDDNTGGDGGGGGDMAKGGGDMATGGGDMATGGGDMATGGGDMATQSMPDLATNIDFAGITPNCQTYCTALQATCSHNSGWPTGMLSDTTDTLGCREARAIAAMVDPTDNCNAGGISGDNVCGTWCENYCYLALRNCTGANQLYADNNACMTACAGIPSDPTMPNAQSGNTLQCRIYHLNNAGGSQQLAMTHCPHAQVTPTGPCS